MSNCSSTEICLRIKNVTCILLTYIFIYVILKKNSKGNRTKMMIKRILPILTSLVIICCCALPVFSAEETQALTSAESYSDSLSSETEEKWYSFETDKEGDTVIIAKGLKSEADSVKYHWHINVYASDRSTLIAQSDISGFCNTDSELVYTVNDGQISAEGTIITLPKTAIGKYFIQITSVNYIPDQYELTVYFHRYQDSVSYGADGIQTVSNSGECLCVLNDIAFIKLTDGEAYMALQKSSGELIMPVLISTDPSAVEYLILSIGKVIKATNSPVDINGVTYYYSEINDIYFVEPPELYSPERPENLYFSNASKGDVVTDILTEMEKELLGEEYEDELGEEISDFIGNVKYYWQKYWWGLLVIGGIVLFCVFGSAIDVSRSDDDPLIHMTGDEDTGNLDKYD